MHESQKTFRLSALIPWCDRPEIEKTLAENGPILAAFDAEILVLNCGGNDKQLKTLLLNSSCSDLRCVCVTDSRSPRFNKSYALNVGAYLSRSPRIFALDADIILNQRSVKEAIENLQPRTFVTVAKVFESKPKEVLATTVQKTNARSVIRSSFIEIAFPSGVEVKVRTQCRNDTDGSRAGPGLIFVRKEHLLQVEGYNADLRYWGWEDHDLQVRLRQCLALEHREAGRVLHLSHGNRARSLFGLRRQLANKINFGVCCSRYAEGNFQGTYSRDVTSWISQGTSPL